MIDMLKRHAFLFGLAGGVLVVILAVGLLVFFFYTGPNAETRRALRSTLSQCRTLMGGSLHSSDLVEKMAEKVQERRDRYEKLLDYIRQLGAERKPVVEGLFPTSTDSSLRHSFKAGYDAALNEFMEKLNAATPVEPERGRRDEAREEIAKAIEEARKHTMYVAPKRSFFRPEWVDEPKAPDLEVCRYGQEDIWLMRDLVDILDRMNEEVLQKKKAEPVIANAPVKEIVQIRIGCEYAVLPETDMRAGSGRYRPETARGGSRGGAEGRLATLSGRTSEAGFYKVLPWRLVVVVEAEHANELVRRIRGTESFLSVEAWRMEPVTEATFERTNDLMAFSREDYGKQGVARLELVGESVIFQLADGRVTTLPSETAEPPAEKAGDQG